ncbi:HR-like lesion-inducing protein-related isoform 1 [Hibiscus syriacus]|uniref:HR-like lesion-inducing protein-related isoform 1 n=1 Tax=Hibiscus syriacus TaxID=106335 RepID=A0A6A2WTF3_HIBSY|nr:HR-like lesion-inducing protein-related isoform 1 [Hibiscus syriacus]
MLLTVQHVGRFNEFGVDGGPAAKELIPKLDDAKKHISSRFHVNFPDIEVRQLVSTAIILKGLGAIVFVFGHGLGAFLSTWWLAPLLHDFYNYSSDEPDTVFCWEISCSFLYGDEELNAKETTKEEGPEAKSYLGRVELGFIIKDKSGFGSGRVKSPNEVGGFHVKFAILSATLLPSQRSITETRARTLLSVSTMAALIPSSHRPSEFRITPSKAATLVLVFRLHPN